MTSVEDGELTMVPTRHPGRTVASIILIILTAMLVQNLFANKNFQWDVVRKYFFSSSVLQGLGATIELTVLSMVIGIVLGIGLAVMRQSANPIVSRLALLYIWFFRGTPLLVQLIFWFNLSALYPKLSLSVPFGPQIVSGSANALITPFIAALLGLALNEAAYMAEIVRGGLLGVPRGQAEAASAIGMHPGLAMRRIILPQAMRIIVPPTGNQIIGMLKTTSLVSVIATQELLYSVQLIYARTFETIPLLIVACLWYLIVTTVLSIGQHFVEKRLGRSVGEPTRLNLRRRNAVLVSDLRDGEREGM